MVLRNRRINWVPCKMGEPRPIDVCARDGLYRRDAAALQKLQREACKTLASLASRAAKVQRAYAAPCGHSCCVLSLRE